jgi:hypothetical protein
MPALLLLLLVDRSVLLNLLHRVVLLFDAIFLVNRLPRC